MPFGTSALCYLLSLLFMKIRDTRIIRISIRISINHIVTITIIIYL